MNSLRLFVLEDRSQHTLHVLVRIVLIDFHSDILLFVKESRSVVLSKAVRISKLRNSTSIAAGFVTHRLITTISVLMAKHVLATTHDSRFLFSHDVLPLLKDIGSIS